MPYPEHPQNSPSLPLRSFMGRPHFSHIFMVLPQAWLLQTLEVIVSTEGARQFEQTLALPALQPRPVLHT